MPDFSDLLRRAAEMDRADALAHWRAQFALPQGVIYLDGNSLGPISLAAERSLQRVVNEWRQLGISAWTDAQPPWVDLPEKIAAQLASLLGSAQANVCVTGSTTGNLHQLLATLFDPTSSRRIILGDELNFPSDAHAITSHLRLRGLDPANYYREIKSRDGRTLAEDDIIAAFTDDVQLVVLPSVLFASGQLLDVARVTRAAHERGIVVGWDCSHSIGAVPHSFDADGVDFAFWCSYKYLNAGPGAVGGLYLHPRHHGRAAGLAGWWGVRLERRFAMSHQHEQTVDATALHVGTPHLLSLAPLEGSLEIFAAAGGLGPLRAKSLALTSWLIELAERELAPLGFQIATPREPQRRGGHVSLAHPEAWRICQALKQHGVIPDFRPPDLIRLAPAPLYNTFTECAETVTRLRKIVETGAHLNFNAPRTTVT